MQKLFVVIAALTMALTTPARAQIQPPALDADMRCVLLAMTTAGTAGDNVQMQQGSLMLALYYAGRVQGYAPEHDMEGALTRLAVSMSLDQVEAERPRCIQGANATLQSLGQAATRAAQATQAAPTGAPPR